MKPETCYRRRSLRWHVTSELYLYGGTVQYNNCSSRRHDDSMYVCMCSLELVYNTDYCKVVLDIFTFPLVLFMTAGRNIVSRSAFKSTILNSSLEVVTWSSSFFSIPFRGYYSIPVEHDIKISKDEKVIKIFNSQMIQFPLKLVAK